MAASNNGWLPYEKHVLAELQRLNECYESLRKDVEKIKIETGQLKIRAGLTGLVGGAIPVLIAFGAKIFTG